MKLVVENDSRISWLTNVARKSWFKVVFATLVKFGVIVAGVSRNHTVICLKLSDDEHGATPKELRRSCHSILYPRRLSASASFTRCRKDSNAAAAKPPALVRTEVACLSHARPLSR